MLVETTPNVPLMGFLSYREVMVAEITQNVSLMEFLGYRVVMATETTQNVPLRGGFGFQSGGGCGNSSKCATDGVF